jgi:CRISPR type III-B/RAMP module RAMP protein Cmr6
MSDSYDFPKSMGELLDQHVGQCKNLGLILDKYPPATVSEDSQAKSEWLKRLEPNKHIDASLAQSAYARWHTMMSAMGATLFNAVLDWRMVIGLGGETVLETDITLHHLYGIPFIPGSALKGLTRAYVSAEYKQYYTPENQPEDQRKPSKKTDEDHSEIKRIFGAQERAGTVIFFDAMPLPGTITFVLDIMNSHYPDYYKSLKSENIIAPTNDQRPNPITFLAVKGTTFAFALAPRDASKAQNVKDVEDVGGWLQEALQKYGVGGKTSAGYGYFSIVSDEGVSKDYRQQEPVPLAKPLTIERKPVELPPFQVNQEIMGVVTTEVQRTSLIQRFPADSSSAFLIYRDRRNRDYSLEDVVILVSTVANPEAQNWKAQEQRKCQITQIERRDNCTILVCKTARSKFADKKKR